MGKKKRNADGSKKRKLSSEEEVLFERYSIFELRNGNSDGLDYCSSCKVEVPVNVKKLHEHFTSNSHANKHMIETLIPLFTKHGITRVESHFFCVYHQCEIHAKAKTLIEHLKEHNDREVVVDPHVEGDFGSPSSEVVVFRQKFWRVDLQSTNAGLDLQLQEFDRLERPFILRDDSPSKNFLGSVRCDVFTTEELAVMFKASSYLEINGDNVDRLEAIQRTKMKAFGMRWAMGDTGW